jgi:hypothetical protein
MNVLDYGINKKLKTEDSFGPGDNTNLPPPIPLGFDPSSNVPSNLVSTDSFNPNQMPVMEMATNTSQRTFTHNVIVPLKLPVSFYEGDMPDMRYHPLFLLNQEKCCLPLLNYRLMKYFQENPQSRMRDFFSLIKLIGVQRNSEESRYEEQNPFFFDNQRYTEIYDERDQEIVWKNESVTYQGLCETKNMWPGYLESMREVGFVLIKVKNLPKVFRFSRNESRRQEFYKPSDETSGWVWQVIPVSLVPSWGVKDIKNYFKEEKDKYDYTEFAFYRLGFVKLETDNGIKKSEFDVVSIKHANLVQIVVDIATVPSISVK